MFNQNSSYIKLLKEHCDSSLLLSSLPPPPLLGKVMWSLYYSLSCSHGRFMWSEEKWGRLLSRSKKIRILICINKVKVMLMERIWISILDPPDQVSEGNESLSWWIRLVLLLCRGVSERVGVGLRTGRKTPTYPLFCSPPPLPSLFWGRLS